MTLKKARREEIKREKAQERANRRAKKRHEPLTIKFEKAELEYQDGVPTPPGENNGNFNRN